MDDRVRQTLDRVGGQLPRRFTLRGFADGVDLPVAQLPTSLSIHEVMSQVAADRSHFARDFSREYGFSPRGPRG